MIDEVSTCLFLYPHASLNLSPTSLILYLLNERASDEARVPRRGLMEKNNQRFLLKTVAYIRPNARSTSLHKNKVACEQLKYFPENCAKP